MPKTKHKRVAEILIAVLSMKLTFILKIKMAHHKSENKREKINKKQQYVCLVSEQMWYVLEKMYLIVVYMCERFN